MARFAIVEEGKVTNIILANDASAYQGTGQPIALTDSQAVNIGDIYANNTFSPPVPVMGPKSLTQREFVDLLLAPSIGGLSLQSFTTAAADPQLTGVWKALEIASGNIRPGSQTTFALGVLQARGYLNSQQAALVVQNWPQERIG